MIRKLLGFAFWMGITFAAAGIGGLASTSSVSFYREIVRPEWAPPGWLFGPVWSVLYTMMGLSAWLVWRERETDFVFGALFLYIAQLGLNALWTWLFFAWRMGMWAFVEIVLLWLFIVATMKAFARIRPLAAWLLAPYLAWVTFAAALAFALWRMNPALL